MGATSTSAISAALGHPSPGVFDVWVDLLAPDTASRLAALDLDGHRHGGLAWRLDGWVPLRLRHAPAPSRRYADEAAAAVVAARAWAVGQRGGLVSVDYDVPWAYAVSIARDAHDVALFGRRVLLRLASRHGDWLADFVAAAMDTPPVRAVVAADSSEAFRRGIRATPVVDIDDRLLGPERDATAVRLDLDAMIAAAQADAAQA